MTIQKEHVVMAVKSENFERVNQILLLLSCSLDFVFYPSFEFNV